MNLDGFTEEIIKDTLQDFIKDFLQDKDPKEINEFRKKVEKFIPKNHVLLFVSNENKEITAILTEIKNTEVCFNKKPFSISVNKLLDEYLDEV